MNKNRLDFTKGGRGKVAFYTTNLHRIPVPVKKYVEQISEIHKNSVANNRQDDFLNIMEAFFE